MARWKGCSFLLILALNATTFPVTAQQSSRLVLKDNAPTTYIVVEGDTLWEISAMYLNDPWLWPQLWDINSNIANPHRIYPGDRIYLVWRNGQPKLQSKSVITLKPQAKQTQKLPLPTVEQGLVIPYLQLDRLIDLADVETSNRVVGNDEGRQYIAGLDKLYFSGQHSHLKWGVYRLSQQFKSRGRAIAALRLIATGELVYSAEEISALHVQEQRQEILLNDLVLPILDINTLNLTTTFHPHPSPANVEAQILGSLQGSELVAQNQIVILDRGVEDGLKQGSMFNIKQDGRTVFGRSGHLRYEESWFDEAVQLPDENVGELMVIRPYSHFSLALITRSPSAIATHTIAVSPLTNF